MANNLLSVWSTIGSVLLAILVLLLMITVHEFGHYIAGKILHFKINEFSIGFGPALFKHKRKHSDEVFSIRLIPLGGYCAFAGEDGTEEENAPEAASAPEPFGEDFSEHPTEPAPEAAETEAETEAEAVRAESDISEGQITETPAEGKKRKKKKREKKEVKLGNFTEKKPWQRIIVLVSGALMNYIFAVLLIIICFAAYGQTMTAVFRAAPLVNGEEIYSEEHSLQDLDVLLKANGKDIYLTTDIAKAVNGKKKGEIVKFTISRAFGVVWEADKNGKDKPTFDHREKMTVEIELRADVKVKNSADLDCVWDALGVKYTKTDKSSGYELASASYRFGFFETIGRSFMYSFKIAGSIFKIIGELLTGHLGITALGGPVTTIKMTSKVASTSFHGLLEIAGFIGVNLAVFNLLPIPALDGSKVVFTVIEWIRKKPVSRKVEGAIHAVGFILLLGFAVLVDILQFVL